METHFGATDNLVMDPVSSLDVNGTFEFAPGRSTRMVSAHFASIYSPTSPRHNHPGPMLKTLSQRCPKVLVTCFSHDAQNNPSTFETYQAPAAHGYAAGAALPETLAVQRDVDDDTAGRDKPFAAIFPRRPDRARTRFLDWATTAKELWQASTFSTTSRLQASSRATLNAISDRGPEGLADLVSAQSPLPQAMIVESVSRLAPHCRLPSGFGLVDAAIASPMKHFASTAMHTFVSAWAPKDEGGTLSPEMKGIYENNVCHLQPERVARLAALCADDDCLAAAIGTDAGCLANGIHVAAFMAIVAAPGTLESRGVANVLRQATFTLPTADQALPPTSPEVALAPCPESGADKSRLQTLYALASSSNEHAWDFLIEQTSKGAIRGFDGWFLAATVLHDENVLPRFLNKYGSETVKEVARLTTTPLSPEITAILATHDHQQQLGEIFSLEASPPSARMAPNRPRRSA
jgi:hypothetical protein